MFEHGAISTPRGALLKLLILPLLVGRWLRSRDFVLVVLVRVVFLDIDDVLAGFLQRLGHEVADELPGCLHAVSCRRASGSEVLLTPKNVMTPMATRAQLICSILSLPLPRLRRPPPPNRTLSQFHGDMTNMVLRNPRSPNDKKPLTK